MTDLWRELIPIYYARGLKRGFDLKHALLYAINRTNQDLLESFT